MRSILLAIQFLTILPVRLRGKISESDIARCATFFPLAGALQGLIHVCGSRCAHYDIPCRYRKRVRYSDCNHN